MSSARIVLAGSLAEYQEGGGIWAMHLQYLLGLNALGHEVFWLDVLVSTGDPARDRDLADSCVERLDAYGLGERTIVLVLEDEELTGQPVESLTTYNASLPRLKEVARSADFLWNLCGALKQPLLSLFKRRVLVDQDPGVYQVSGLLWDMGLDDHDLFFTLGGKLHDPDCEVPTLGVTWHRFTPFVFLPIWTPAPDPGPSAPFTSVTEWDRREIWLGERVLSRSKRAAYFRYLDLPARTGRPFELAANIDPHDDDREHLTGHGWQLVHPHQVARTPELYQGYIKASRAEFLCPKPIYTELATGWVSERSVCYLATGRPVICEDTGFSAYLPVGEGLLPFRNIDEAANAVAEVSGDYRRHSTAARALAEELFDARRCLQAMVDICGSS